MYKVSLEAAVYTIVHRFHLLAPNYNACSTVSIWGVAQGVRHFIEAEYTNQGAKNKFLVQLRIICEQALFDRANS